MCANLFAFYIRQGERERERGAMREEGGATVCGGVHCWMDVAATFYCLLEEAETEPTAENSERQRGSDKDQELGYLPAWHTGTLSFWRREKEASDHNNNTSGTQDTAESSRGKEQASRSRPRVYGRQTVVGARKEERRASLKDVLSCHRSEQLVA